MTAEDYYERLVAGEITDPTVSAQMRIGFRPGGLIPDYVQDPPLPRLRRPADASRGSAGFAPVTIPSAFPGRGDVLFDIETRVIYKIDYSERRCHS